jgi:hypothetical protein
MLGVSFLSSRGDLHNGAVPGELRERAVGRVVEYRSGHGDWEPAIARLGSVRLVASGPRRSRVEPERAFPAGPHVLDMLIEVELVEQADAFGQ